MATKVDIQFYSDARDALLKACWSEVVLLGAWLMH